MHQYQAKNTLGHENHVLSTVIWRLWLLCVAMACAFCAVPVQAQQYEANSGDGVTQSADDSPQPPVTMGMVRKQLRLLGSSRLQDRDAAEKALTEMGTGILPFLPQVDAQTSGEMKIRLERIRQAMTYQSTQKYFEASSVTLTGKMSLVGALAVIEEQTQNVIELQGFDPAESVELELDLKDVPFWSAISELMSQANLRINSFGTTAGNLVLTRGATASAFVDGPFRIEATSVQTRIQPASPENGQLDVSFQFAWEPRLKPIFMRVPMSSVKAQAGENALEATNQQAAPEVPLNLGTCTAQVDLMLNKPSRKVEVLASLEGMLYVAIPSESYLYKFEKFANGAQQSEKKGDVKVTLQGARKNGAVYEMRIFAEFGDAKGGLESYRSWIMANEAYLLDENDRRLENVGLQTYARTQNGIGIAYLFQINDDPNSYTLVYESPVSIDEQQFKYRLENIPLP